MGLATTLRNAVKGAIQKLGPEASDGLIPLVTYVQSTPTSYDATTDAMGALETTYTNVPAALVASRDEERDWADADVHAKKALIAFNDLPIVPEQTDYLRIGGVKWEIKKIKQLPGMPVHVLFIQEP